MNIENFRFQPACFVGNPGHDVQAVKVIAEFDSIHSKRFHGQPYVPECMRDREWAQSYVMFAVRLASGLRWVKVFSNN
jgi:hypothetical protein